MICQFTCSAVVSSLQTRTSSCVGNGFFSSLAYIVSVVGMTYSMRDNCVIMHWHIMCTSIPFILLDRCKLTTDLLNNF